MNYDQQITALIEAMKTDKRFDPKIRNYAMSDAVRLQAVIRMGLTTTNREPMGEELEESNTGCNCPSGTISKSCPIHAALL